MWVREIRVFGFWSLLLKGVCDSGRMQRLVEKTDVPPPPLLFRSRRWPSFTVTNGILHILSVLVGSSLLRLSTYICFWSIAISFAIARLLSPRIYIVQAVRVGLPDLLHFHIANSLVHHLPPLLLFPNVPHPPPPSSVAAMCVGMHLGWGLFVSGGTMRLDTVYSPMRPSDWFLLWTVSFCSELLLPYWIL